ncbi:MAG: co-chaperone YbbN [Thermoleophilia bacterium]|nr:co-chaperone YbbN [Thermoleophilia bacterium]
MTAAAHASEDTFARDVLERSQELPVVVDFWAEWCAPCHMLAPVLEREVDERAGQVVLVKVDIDANPALAQRYAVSGIPAVKAFRNGHVVREFVGAQPPPAVAAFLDALTEPSEAERLVEELRSAGELPGVVGALDAGDVERALELLLAEAGRREGHDRDGVRRLMLALFADLGSEHPLTLRFRRRLATVLF